LDMVIFRTLMNAQTREASGHGGRLYQVPGRA
jgi:hypothetical protein